MSARQKVLALLTNLVPYHHARWTAFASSELYECTVAEIQRRDAFKVLELSDHVSSSYLRRTLVSANHQDLTTKPAGVQDLVRRTLDELRPQIVCLNGYSLAFNWTALEWCLAQGAMPVICSESNEFDSRRFWLAERAKRFFVGHCVAGLAGGRPQADYLVKLGLPRERVFLGYDVVDNAHFGNGADAARSRRSEVRSRGSLPEGYFLAVARFAEKKNLVRLVEAYAQYRGLAADKFVGADSSTLPWHLVLAGDGPLRSAIEARIDELQVRDFVHLAGAQGYAELPVYYGLARAFVHASTTEQWGLVVNEAMASGLPVLVSNRCGCAPDLVQEGVNGFTFDPYDVEELAQLMLKLSTLNSQLSTMGAASRRIIAEWGPDRFAAGLKAAVDCALAVGSKEASLLDRLLLRLLVLRR
jgi:glycosyltransferase involved in cell wall biosynthesis